MLAGNSVFVVISRVHQSMNTCTLCCAYVCAGSGSRQEYTSPPSAVAPNIRGCHPARNIDYGIYVICTLCVHVSRYVCLCMCPVP